MHQLLVPIRRLLIAETRRLTIDPDTLVPLARPLPPRRITAGTAILHLDHRRKQQQVDVLVQAEAGETGLPELGELGGLHNLPGVDVGLQEGREDAGCRARSVVSSA